MKDLTETALLVFCLLLMIAIWALVMAVPAYAPSEVKPAALAILQHSVAPITDWMPHTSTVLR